MKFIDSFQTTNSFRFDRNRSTSTFSLSSSSGYGSPSNLSQTSSQCRLPFSKYFRQKLSKHKSLAEIFFSPIRVKSNEQIYDDAWNLDQQMNRIRSKLTTSINQSNDSDSVISMSVDQPEQFYDTIDDDDEDLLRAASWYQEGLSRQVCEEYLGDHQRPIGSFILRRSFTCSKFPFVLSIRTQHSLVEHFLIERTSDNLYYRFHGSSKQYDKLSSLILYHTVLTDILPVRLRLPVNDVSSTPVKRSTIRAVRF